MIFRPFILLTLLSAVINQAHGEPIETQTLESDNDKTPSSSSTGKSSSSTSTPSQIQPPVTSSITDAVYTSGIPKIRLFADSGNSPYNAHIRIGDIDHGQDFSVRMDMIQPDIWVMNAAKFYDCNYLDEWYASELSIYSTYSDWPASITTQEEFTETLCAAGGRYDNSLRTIAQGIPDATTSYYNPQATAPGIVNGQEVSVPYVNSYNIAGRWQTDKISVNVSSGEALVLSNFSFVDADVSVLFYGSLGLAGNQDELGFLYSLTDQEIIASPGYSLFFDNSSTQDNNTGLLMPGIVDKQYYVDPLYAFDMLPHVGPPNGVDTTIVKLPTLLLNDISIINTKTSQTLSLKTNDSLVPVVLDSRTSYSYLPIDVVINLAVQLNAYYSEDAQAWLVECDKISTAPAAMVFTLNDLEVNVPVCDIQAPFFYQGSYVKFSDGAAACSLFIVPNTKSGYNSLGLPFITNVFLAVDNEGGTIAIANTNHSISVDDPIASPSASLHTVSSAFNFTGNASVAKTVGFIKSSSIPFATYKSNPDATVTFTGMGTSKGATDIPSRFSGYISDGIFITHADANTTTTLPGGGAASAATADTSTLKAMGSSLHNPFKYFVTVKVEMNILAITVLAVTFGICMM